MLKLQPSELLDLITSAGQGIDKKNLIRPIFANLKIELKDKKLTMTGGDGIMFVSKTMTVDSEDSFNILVNANYLTSLVRTCESETEITVNGTVLEITCKKSVYKFPTQEGKDYPDFEAVIKGNTIPFYKDIGTMLSKVLICLGSEVLKPCYRCVSMQEHDGKIKLIATDAKRLAVAAIADTTPATKGINVLIPGRFAEAMSSLLEQEAEFKIDTHAIQLNTSSTMIYSRLVEDSFPKWWQIIPKAFNAVFNVDKAETYDLIKGLLPVASIQDNIAEINIGKDNFTVKASSDWLSGVACHNNVKTDFDKTVNIGMNLKFLHQAFKCCSQGNVQWSIASPTAPTLIKGENDSWFYIIMPVLLD